MDTQFQNSKGDGPIIRLTASDRVATFQANSNSIYNKYTPFTAHSIGPSQPFVYTKISASTLSKNLTKYDSQALPIGSTVRDLQRIGQYSVTGNGILYLGKQLLLQNTNAFNETRIYNPLSLLKATARPGSLGLIDYPQRHLETSGGILNFFKDALLSTIGIQSKNLSAISKRPIEGTATGKYSNYADARGGARAGVLRYNTAERASTKFNEVWVSAGGGEESSGKFLKNLGNALLSKLKSLIPSTNPMGAFGGKTGTNWEYRPEYKTGEDGVYHVFLDDKSTLLKTTQSSVALFYNDEPTIQFNGVVKNYHKYSPQKQEREDTRVWYANDDKIRNEVVGIKDTNGNTNNLENLHKRMIESIDSFQGEKNQFRRSAERYSEVKVKNPDGKETSYPTYKNIPENKSQAFESKMTKLSGTTVGTITLDKRDFAKASGSIDGYDRYNALPLLGTDGKFRLKFDGDQSKDIIFFYFYDLINKVYIPFRATINSLTDQHSAEWEEINYIGRADKLFLYKGFSRDVNLSFTVYANSAIEMIPMWERIDYLTGLTRPSKYTGKATVTNTELDTTTVTGKESRFIYPPMINFRVGDMYVDQPAVLSSVSITIPDDSNWESLRSDDYFYYASSTNKVQYPSGKVKSRQLPLKVDVSVALKLLEKKQSLGSDYHFGYNTELST